MNATSRFSLLGGAEVEERIRRDVLELTDFVVRDLAHWRPVAVYLGGGYGRGEGGVLRVGAQELPYNDYDLFVVTQGLPRWASPSLRHRLSRFCARETSRLGVEVEVGHLRAEELPRGPFTLMRLDFKHGARKLWGPFDAQVALPPMPPALLPRREAAYLLVNRGALLVMASLLGGGADHDERIRRYVRKAWLAVGDAWLIDSFQYNSSWLVRRTLVSASALPPAWKHAYDAAIEARFGGPTGDLDSDSRMRGACSLKDAADALRESLAQAYGRSTSLGRYNTPARMLLDLLAQPLVAPHLCIDFDARVTQAEQFLSAWRQVA